MLPESRKNRRIFPPIFHNLHVCVHSRKISGFQGVSHGYTTTIFHKNCTQFILKNCKNCKIKKNAFFLKKLKKHWNPTEIYWIFSKCTQKFLPENWGCKIFVCAVHIICAQFVVHVAHTCFRRFEWCSEDVVYTF